MAAQLEMALGGQLNTVGRPERFYEWIHASNGYLPQILQILSIILIIFFLSGYYKIIIIGLSPRTMSQNSETIISSECK